MSDNDITWDALLVSKTEANNKVQTVWEKKNFKAPDSKEKALFIAKSLFESTNDSTPNEKVYVKNVIRIGSLHE